MTPIRPLLALLLGCTLASPCRSQDGGPYLLKPGDQVRLSVFQEPDLLTEVRLTSSGEASFPLIGSVQLGGLTLKEAENAVTTLYNTDYLVEPRLSINILVASAERVTVIGAVVKPGEIPIPPNAPLDLASAIDWAGGPSANADASRIELKRNGTTSTYELAKLQAKGARQILLRHGDRVSVAASPFANKMVMVAGEVKQPGSVPFPVGGGLDLNVAIGLAGGLAAGADENRITVKRGGKIYSASMRAGERTLVPGDIVSVPPSRFLGKFVTVMGQVGRSGPVPFPPDGKLDVLSAVARAGDFARLANKKKVTVTRRVGEQNKSWRLDLTEMAEGKARLFYLQPGDTLSVPERRF